MRSKILLGVATFFSVLFFVGLYFDNQLLRVVVKPFPVLILAFLIKRETKYEKFIFIGLLFSVLGDILLELPYNLFVFGLVAFLTAHVNYIIAFVSRNRKLYFLAAIGFYLIGASIYFTLYNSLATMAIPVFVYILVIITMLWRAYAQYNYNIYAKFAFYGAVSFVFSDTLIAFNKFYEPINYARFAIMLTYWSAQLLIFWSAYKNNLSTQLAEN